MFASPHTSPAARQRPTTDTANANVTASGTANDTANVNVTASGAANDTATGPSVAGSEGGRSLLSAPMTTDEVAGLLHQALRCLLVLVSAQSSKAWQPAQMLSCLDLRASLDWLETQIQQGAWQQPAEGSRVPGRRHSEGSHYVNHHHRDGASSHGAPAANHHDVQVTGQHYCPHGVHVIHMGSLRRGGGADFPSGALMHGVVRDRVQQLRRKLALLQVEHSMVNSRVR